MEQFPPGDAAGRRPLQLQALMERVEGCWLHMQIPRLYFTIPKSPDFF